MKLIGRKPKEKFLEIGEGIEIKKDGIKGEIQKIVLPDKDRNRHMFSFGTTGVGKTRLIEAMAENDIKKGRNVLIVDPKGDGELMSKVREAAVESGRKDDFMLINPIFPEYSAKINPLSNYFMPEELVGHIVSAVEVGSEPYFYNVSYEISLAVVMSFLEIARKEGVKPEFNYYDIKKFVSRNSLGVLYSELRLIDTEDSNRLAADIVEIMRSPADYYAKISSSLRVALTELSQGNIGKIIGSDYCNEFIDRIESARGLIAMVQLGSLLTRKASYTLGKVVCSMIQSSVGRIYASNGKYGRPVVLYLDEAQSFLYKGIEELFAKGGSANLWMNAFCQSVSQLEDKLGRTGASVILDCTNTKIFMRVPDPDSAEYVSKFFPEQNAIRPLYSVEGGVAGSSNRELGVKIESVMRLKPRDFFLSTYSGTYRGKVKRVNPCKTAIKFPDIDGYRFRNPRKKTAREIGIEDIASGWTKGIANSQSIRSDLSEYLSSLLQPGAMGEGDEGRSGEDAEKTGRKVQSRKEEFPAIPKDKSKRREKPQRSASGNELDDPIEEKKEKEIKAIFSAVRIDKAMRHIARFVNVIEFDQEKGRKRWHAATVDGQVIVESELIWKAVCRQLDRKTTVLVEVDRELRYDIQRRFLKKIKDKKLISDRIELGSRSVGVELNLALESGKGFNLYGLVLKRHAFTREQGERFNAKIPKGIQNLKGFEQI